MEEKETTQSLKRNAPRTNLQNKNGTVQNEALNVVNTREWNGVQLGSNGGREAKGKMPKEYTRKRTQCRKKKSES